MGSRYGTKVRSKERAALQQKNARHECPQCGKNSVRRVSTALWKCSSCSGLFAGGAYSPETMIGSSARKVITSLKHGVTTNMDTEVEKAEEGKEDKERK